MRLFELESPHFYLGGVAVMLFMMSACASDSAPQPVTPAPIDWLPATADLKAEPDAPEPSDPLLRILWKYAPDSFYVIDRTENLPATVKFGPSDWTIRRPDDVNQTVTNADGSQTITRRTVQGFRRWIFETEPLKQVIRLEIATHESKHRYTADYAVPQLAVASNGSLQRLRSAEYSDHRTTLYYSYYLSRQRTRFNRLYPTFPAKEIASYIPQENRSDRYEIYVADEGAVAQDIGIFSLLDEYNAYYWSQRTMYDLYKYFQTELPLSGDTWLEYFGGHSGSFVAWAEFRYFILTYLMYAKDNHPDLYQKLLADERLRETFTEIDDQYIELHKHVITRLTQELPAYLQSKGIKAAIRAYNDPATGKFADYIFYVDNHGRGLHWDKYQALSQILRTPAYLAIANQFRTTPAAELPPMEVGLAN
jgi:hypothetical protein